MHCRRQLGKLQEHTADFAAKGASIVAISVDPADKSAALADKIGVEFPILSDLDLATIKNYGIEDVGNDISLPASFVIGRDGKIAYAYIGDRPRDRPEVPELLGAL